MQRLCVSCRLRKDVNQLLPFSIGTHGSLELGRGRRTAWVCIKKSCLLSIEKSPQKTFRSLRAEIKKPVHSLQQAKNFIKKQIYKHLSHAQRSGNVYSGHSKIITHQKKIFFILLSELSQNLFYWKKTLPNINIITTDSSPQELGLIIKKGSRSVLGISPNRYAQKLLKYLQHYKELR